MYKPDILDLTNLLRSQDHYSSLQNGTLYTFSVPIIYFLSPTALPGYSPYVVTSASRITGVKKYYPVGLYNVVLKNDNTAWFIYGIGKIEGPSGELKNVKDIVAAYHDGLFFQNRYTKGMSGDYYSWGIDFSPKILETPIYNLSKDIRL